MKGRQKLGVVPKKPFDWGQFGYVIYRFLRLIFLMLLLAGIIVGPYYGWQYLKENNLFFKIETVSVYGDIEYLPQERINVLAQDAVGQNLIGLDIQKYQDNILSESWVKSVSLKRQWLHELEVHLVEQDPVAIWNESQMVDSEGVIFTPSFIPNLPWIILSGPDDKVHDVLRMYEKTKIRLSDAGFNLKQMVLDENGSWTILLDNDLLLIMGSEDYFQRLSRFMRQFPDRDVLDVIQHIDFRYNNGFSVKWKEDHISDEIDRRK